MKYARTILAALAAAGAAACGGERNASQGAARDTSAAAAPSAAAPSAQPSAGGGATTTPDWMKVDESGKTVSMDVEAGKTPDNNHWNFNGYDNGNATITVPSGYKVTIDFSNHDPAIAHSLGIDSRSGNFEATLTPQPAFPSAVTPDPTNPAGGTGPGKSAKITFTADKPGNYSMVCYMPGHAAAGMWIHFDVTSGGAPGVKTGS
jgi:FtsP/CotA-like multicopper oxidase with cupredoxin domain